MSEKGKREHFKLEIPLDASGIEDFKPEQTVKVVVRKSDGTTDEQEVQLSKEGKGIANFTFAENPGAVRIVMGPSDASAEELLGMQTISLDMPSRQWLEQREWTLKPIDISSYYWHWWFWWCRTFTIRGRVICPNGNPVPGATVCAYDVDWWFIWSSTQLVGCETTDMNGAFEIKFRWCCGFWPRWWWLHRTWQVDPLLLRRVSAVLQRDPNLRLSRVGHQPSLAVFGGLLGDLGVASSRPLTPADANRLERIRDRLLQELPIAPELESLRIWPWWPWWPWLDCTPDIIFKVTQDCLVPGAVIVDEGVGDTRWNIADPLNVILIANEEACCRPTPPDPPYEEGDCLVIEQVCRSPIDTIGGNVGAPATPVGYLNPGATMPGTTGYAGDRPFAGIVHVEKNFGDMLNVDFYEIEYSSDGGTTWDPLSPGAAVDFRRHWMEMVLGFPTGSVLFRWVPIAEAGGGPVHTVVESREHFETHGGLGGWDVNRFWLVHRDLVVPLSSPRFPDGTYHFRVVGWQIDAAGELFNGRVLPLCGTQKPNFFVLTFDNRLLPDPAHPTGPTHPCDSGTVHLCATEPDTDFIAVRINGSPTGPCEVVDWVEEGTLEIDFMAHDPDGHLANYTLIATYAENLAVNLLAQPGATITPIVPGTPWGPTYGEALGQGAAAPHWYGGNFRLSVPISQAFPEPCCYQLELRAWKRNVVNCHTAHYDYRNLSEYILGVGVCPPGQGTAAP